MRKICSIEGCEIFIYSHGLCHRHLRRQKKYGDPLGGPLPLNPIQRFWTKIDQTESCWTWTGSINNSGYGSFWTAGKSISAHRFAYELLIGPIPTGLITDHQCHNPQTCVSGNKCLHRRCVNPAHIALVTSAENSALDRRFCWQLHRTHCPQDHPYNLANTYVDPKTGKRRCRACDRHYRAALRAKLALLKKEEAL